jgi:hypothetical protein
MASIASGIEYMNVTVVLQILQFDYILKILQKILLLSPRHVVLYDCSHD